MQNHLSQNVFQAYFKFGISTIVIPDINPLNHEKGSQALKEWKCTLVKQQQAWSKKNMLKYVRYLIADIKIISSSRFEENVVTNKIVYTSSGLG